MLVSPFQASKSHHKTIKLVWLGDFNLHKSSILLYLLWCILIYTTWRSRWRYFHVLVYHCPLLSHLLVPRWTMILSKFYPDPSSKAWGSPTVKDRTDLQEFLFPQAICQITIAQVALLQGCLPRATNGYSEASWDLMSSLKIMEKHLKKLRSNHAIWSNSVNPAAETKTQKRYPESCLHPWQLLSLWQYIPAWKVYATVSHILSLGLSVGGRHDGSR